MIFEFDSRGRLDELKNHYLSVTKYSNCYSDNLDEFNKLSDKLGIEHRVVRENIDTIKYSLLIKGYTYSEQLVKNTYYHLVNKGRHHNSYLNSFIDSKVPEDRFSPSVKMKEICNKIKELEKGFAFILPYGRNEFAHYDNMVKNRHLYAHKGSCIFEISNFEVIIQVLEYIRIEMKFIIDKPSEKIKTKELLEAIKVLSKKALLDTSSVTHYKEIKKHARELRDNLNNEFKECKLTEEFICIINDISNFDLRTSGFNEKLIKFCDYYQIDYKKE